MIVRDRRTPHQPMPVMAPADPQAGLYDLTDLEQGTFTFEIEGGEIRLRGFSASRAVVVQKAESS